MLKIVLLFTSGFWQVVDTTWICERIIGEVLVSPRRLQAIIYPLVLSLKKEVISVNARILKNSKRPTGVF